MTTQIGIVHSMTFATPVVEHSPEMEISCTILEVRGLLSLCPSASVAHETITVLVY